MITKNTKCVFCSWCREMVKINDVWQPITVNQFARIANEHYKHGICPNCKIKMDKEIEKMEMEEK